MRLDEAPIKFGRLAARCHRHRHSQSSGMVGTAQAIALAVIASSHCGSDRRDLDDALSSTRPTPCDGLAARADAERRIAVVPRCVNALPGGKPHAARCIRHGRLARERRGRRATLAAHGCVATGLLSAATRQRRARSLRLSRSAIRSSGVSAMACTRSGRPIHAGIIEPGTSASRSSRKGAQAGGAAGYVHKGIEKRFEGMSLNEGIARRRVSGDSTVAYAWPTRWRRVGDRTEIPRAPPAAGAIAGTRARGKYLGDLGALGNDAALAFGLAQFSACVNCGCARTAGSSDTAC